MTSTTADGLADVLGILNSVGSASFVPLGGSGRVVRGLVRTATGFEVQAVGKGITAADAVRGAAYELLEHAVYEGALGRSGSLETEVGQLFGHGELARDAIAASVIRSGGQIPANLFDTATPSGKPAHIFVPDALAPAVTTEQKRLRVYFANSTGWAAGRNASQAVDHAIYELLERDAISALMVACAERTPTGWPVHQPGHEADTIARQVGEEFNQTIRLREIPALTGRCVIAFTQKVDPHGRLIVGSGCAPTLAQAALRAVLELEQELCVDAAGLPYGADTPDLESGALDRYPYLIAASNMAYLLEIDDGPSEGDLPSLPSLSLTESENGKPDGLRQADFDLLARSGHPPYCRTVWKAVSSANTDAAPVVVQAWMPGLEKLHVLRHGIPGEPIARLRNAHRLERCRHRSSRPNLST